MTNDFVRVPVCVVRVPYGRTETVDSASMEATALEWNRWRRNVPKKEDIISSTVADPIPPPPVHQETAMETSATVAIQDTAGLSSQGTILVTENMNEV